MKITEKLKATLRKMLSLQLGEVATKDGKKLYWSSEEDLKEGLEVFVEDENGELIPAPNGVYETEDGKKINVEDGVVKKIDDPEAEVAPENAEENLEDVKPAEEPAEDMKDDEKEDVTIEDKVAAVEAKVGEILAAFEQVLNGMSALEGRIEEVEAKVAKIETEPAAEPVEDKPAEPQTRMSRMDILKNLK